MASRGDETETDFDKWKRVQTSFPESVSFSKEGLLILNQTYDIQTILLHLQKLESLTTTLTTQIGSLSSRVAVLEKQALPNVHFSKKQKL
jgi:hypothetical protein